METKMGAESFKVAFEGLLLNRTGIVLNSGAFHQDEMHRDLDRALRLSGLAGDENSDVDAFRDTGGDNFWSDDAPELLAMVDKLGPLNPNLSCEAFIKPFFKHLSLSEFNIHALDDDLIKFTNLTFLDITKNSISAVDFLPPNLKF